MLTHFAYKDHVDISRFQDEIDCYVSLKNPCWENFVFSPLEICVWHNWRWHTETSVVSPSLMSHPLFLPGTVGNEVISLSHCVTLQVFAYKCILPCSAPWHLCFTFWENNIDFQILVCFSSSTNRLITSKDVASVQLNVGHVDENGVYTGQFTTFALCGFVRAQVCFGTQLSPLTTLVSAHVNCIHVFPYLGLVLVLS